MVQADRFVLQKFSRYSHLEGVGKMVYRAVKETYCEDGI